MRRGFLLFLATFGLLVSGCLEDASKPASVVGLKNVKAAAPRWDLQTINETVSQVRYAAVTLLKTDVWHTSFDGVQLHTRVYRHADLGDWKAPILLHMSPYFGPNNAASPVPERGMDGWLIKHFVPRGYAVALSDVRGTGESGGCLEQTGPKQTKDSYKVIEDLAAQPWSNGRVGMIGISYDGETQQSAATAQPPSLKTIVPLASVAGQYEWNFYDGVPYGTNGIMGMVGYAQIGVRPPTVPFTGGGKPTNYGERFECHGENVKEGADPRGDLNQYWKDREIRLNVHKVSTSVLFVHGLEDWNVKPNHIRDWYNLIPGPKHAWIGQWQHNFPDGNSFKREWSRTDWKLTVHRWFDHWLLDVPTGIMDEPAVQVMDSLGRWRFEDSWPPMTTTALTLGLGKDLKPAATGASEVTWEDRGVSMMNAQAGDHESFLSDPLESDLHYAGWPVLSFKAKLSRDGTHFAVHLVDVSPDGMERIINRAYLDAQHRNGLERSVPVPPQTLTEFQIRFFPQDDVVQAGHRLKLRIGAVDDWIQPDGTFSTVTMSLKDAILTVPVVDDATARFFEPLRIES